MHEKIFKAVEYYSGFFFLTSKITCCTSSFSPCLPFNLSSCTTENVGRLVTPAKKLEDTIRLAELVIEVLQQNEEHHAEVSSVPGQVVSPRSSTGSDGSFVYLCDVFPSGAGLSLLKAERNNDAQVRWRQSTLQEECVFRGEGGLKDKLIELCSPRCQSAAFLTAPAGAESGQNIHHQLPARASLSTFQKGRISKSCHKCVGASSQHERGPCRTCCPEGSKENCNKTEQFSFLPLPENSGCFQGSPWVPSVRYLLTWFPVGLLCLGLLGIPQLLVTEIRMIYALLLIVWVI